MPNTSTANATSIAGTVALDGTDTEDCFELSLAADAQLDISVTNATCGDYTTDPVVNVYDLAELATNADASPVASLDDAFPLPGGCSVGSVDLVVGSQAPRHFSVCISASGAPTTEFQVSLRVRGPLVYSDAGAACDPTNELQRCRGDEQCLVTNTLAEQTTTTGVCGSTTTVMDGEACNPGVNGQKQCPDESGVLGVPACAQNMDGVYECLPMSELCGFWARSIMGGQTGEVVMEPRFATYEKSGCSGNMSGGTEYWFSYARMSSNTQVTFTVTSDRPGDAWALVDSMACTADTRTDCSSISGSGTVVVPAGSDTEPITLVFKAPLWSRFSVVVTEE